MNITHCDIFVVPTFKHVARYTHGRRYPDAMVGELPANCGELVSSSIRVHVSIVLWKMFAKLLYI